MHFIEDTNGFYRRVDCLKVVEPFDDEHCMITTEDGARTSIGADALTVVHLLEGIVVQYLPAASKTYKVIVQRDANGKFERLEKVSVVAWAVTSCGDLMPVTVKYGLGCQHCVVLQPHGLVETLDKHWSSLAEYEAELRRDDPLIADLELEASE